MISQKERMERWRFQSPEEPGFHPVIVPDRAECTETRVYRLNLQRGETYELETKDLEMHPVLIQGHAIVSGPFDKELDMERFDACYSPGNETLFFRAIDDCIFYIAAAVDEGYGKPFFRKYDPTLPIGDIHQIHGEGAGRREVMFTLAPQDEASRLLCGLTWSGEGTWTSWPPHQHEKDLEEVYCYFDMPKPRFGFHVSYLDSGAVNEMVVHPVCSGTMVEVPAGYHPTVAAPGGVNAYLWVMGALRHSSRRYDLAIPDQAYDIKKGE